MHAQTRIQLLHPFALVLRMRVFQVVFALFPGGKKSATLGPHSGSELSVDFSPSTPAAHVDSDGPPMWDDEAGNTLWQSRSGQWYLLGSDRTVWWDAPG